ncbi:MAG TPA: CAP domain-containing protein [Gillisia sp.]|nr:CAP domain-containing protein [Gillisia sp.]
MFSSCAKDEIADDSALKTADLVDYVTYSEMELEILTAVNDHRINIGLSELKRVDGITFLASDHNTYMIEKKQVSHDNFQKRYLALVNDIGAKAVSENVGYGYRTGQAVVNAWLNSEGHRKNIEGDYTHFGISVAQDEDGKNYFTNIFARR